MSGECESLRDAPPEISQFVCPKYRVQRREEFTSKVGIEAWVVDSEYAI